ncbi:hypothetical protein EAF04_008426 [Stromatinia cepivora]|nr:hypothetical protein EAF04_008426 [Stromatinia cepivora]
MSHSLPSSTLYSPRQSRSSCHILPTLHHLLQHLRPMEQRHHPRSKDIGHQAQLSPDARSKEIQALDKIVSASPRSSELSSFAITANRSWARNGLPQFLKTFKMSKPQGSPNLVHKTPELLAVVGFQLHYKGRRNTFHGLRFGVFNEEPMDYYQQLNKLEAENTIRLWRVRCEEEGEGTMPPYQIVTFEWNALSCFKDV